MCKRYLKRTVATLATLATLPALGQAIDLNSVPRHERFYCEANDGLGGLVIDGQFRIADYSGVGTFHLFENGIPIKDSEVRIYRGAWMKDRLDARLLGTQYHLGSDTYFGVKAEGTFEATLSRPEKQARKLQCTRVLSEPGTVAYCAVGTRAVAIREDVVTEIAPGLSATYGTTSHHFVTYKLELTHHAGGSAFTVSDLRADLETATTKLRVSAKRDGEHVVCEVHIPAAGAK